MVTMPPLSRQCDEGEVLVAIDASYCPVGMKSQIPASQTEPGIPYRGTFFGAVNA
jgi:hypothetical protein